MQESLRPEEILYKVTSDSRNSSFWLRRVDRQSNSTANSPGNNNPEAEIVKINRVGLTSPKKPRKRKRFLFKDERNLVNQLDKIHLTNAFRDQVQETWRNLERFFGQPPSNDPPPLLFQTEKGENGLEARYYPFAVIRPTILVLVKNRNRRPDYIKEDVLAILSWIFVNHVAHKESEWQRSADSKQMHTQRRQMGIFCREVLPDGRERVKGEALYHGFVLYSIVTITGISEENLRKNFNQKEILAYQLVLSLIHLDSTQRNSGEKSLTQLLKESHLDAQNLPELEGRLEKILSGKVASSSVWEARLEHSNSNKRLIESIKVPDPGNR